MKKLKMIFASLMLIGLMAYAGSAQTDQVCISQDAANKCSEAVDKVKALEQSVTVRDKLIEELKIELAKETQKAADREATIVRLTALFDSLIKSYTKPKKIGLINF